jgi:hypothetical protein
MLEAFATIILVIVGIVLFLFVMIYGIYITFYPLSKTVQGGIDAMKALAEEEKQKVAEKKYARAATAPVRLASKEEHKGA